MRILEDPVQSSIVKHINVLDEFILSMSPGSYLLLFTRFTVLYNTNMRSINMGNKTPMFLFWLPAHIMYYIQYWNDQNMLSSFIGVMQFNQWVTRHPSYLHHHTNGSVHTCSKIKNISYSIFIILSLSWLVSIIMYIAMVYDI